MTLHSSVSIYYDSPGSSAAMMPAALSFCKRALKSVTSAAMSAAVIALVLIGEALGMTLGDE